jgi:gluconolactonase
MYLEKPPRVIDTRVFAALPEQFRRKGVRTAWADANRGGQPSDCFLEGPSFDATGNLYLVDIPFGRIFRVSPAGAWTLVAEYEGWPNGLKIHYDGRILIADYMHGLMELDPRAGSVRPVLTSRNSESFKGCNDLCIAASGDVYFTDQGQTGLHDPTGRVYRLGIDGRLDCLLSNGPSPNGLALDARESVLFVAMTRDNSVWRVPLMRDGGVATVGRFCNLFGPSGPDGPAMDEAGRLIVAHASLGHVFVFACDGECVARVKSCAGKICTNVAFGGPDRRQLYITESETGSVLVADLDVSGIALPRPSSH